MQEVAIKVVRAIKKYTESAEVEARILTVVNKADPRAESNCVRFYDTFTHGSHMCMVREYLLVVLSCIHPFVGGMLALLLLLCPLQVFFVFFTSVLLLDLALVYCAVRSHVPHMSFYVTLYCDQGSSFHRNCVRL